MRFDDCKPGVRVRVTDLGPTGSILADPKYLANREVGAVGFLVSHLKSDTDFWWVKHLDGTSAPYSFSELDLAPDDWNDSPLG